jgi:hypothetical protein
MACNGISILDSTSISGRNGNIRAPDVPLRISGAYLPIRV